MPARAPDPQRRSERARVAVLEAALALCREKGFAALTIEAIAERAEVSKKTIYRWWPSKGAVLLDAVSLLAGRVADFPDTGDLEDDLTAQISVIVDLLTPPDSSPVAALVTEGQRDATLGAQIRDDVVQPTIVNFDARMRSAQAAGQIPSDVDLDVAVDLFYGPVYHRLALRLGMPDQAQIRARVRHVIAGLNALG
ncbi:TetR/AcrR family transcriptional regulator [Cellulomonas sp. JH27-2]|uniref:TetR/AcrR family transcriptional regulator n=1 Tax=Cellulomonas sp. JH27-2 TaxID=2774139 RepID=UPI00177EF7B7|nr:TetR/AcrR family transcriptional regulator [Cellulomonas sp. JH27-2]